MTKKLLCLMSMGALLSSSVFTSLTYAESENEIDLENNEIIEEIIDEESSQELNNETSEETQINLEIDKEDNITTYDGETTHEYLERCFDYEYNSAGTLIINRYSCEETDIVIPTSEYGEEKYTTVVDGAFAGKSINSITFPTKSNIWKEAFSGAIFQGNNVVIGETVGGSDSRYGFIVGENAVLTIKNPLRTYYVEVNGKLVYDLEDYVTNHNNESLDLEYALVKSRIDGEVEIKGYNGTIQRSFMSSEITENGIIKIGEGINEISTYSFGGETYEELPSITNGTIYFPESLEKIINSFNKTEIETNFIFPNSINYVNNSFKNSTINSDINFIKDSKEDNFIINDSFYNSIIGGNLIFSGLNISIKDVSPKGISGDLSFINSNIFYIYNIFKLGNETVTGSINFINTSLDLNGGFFFQGTNILGDFNLSGDNIKLSSGIPVGLKIGGSLNITGNSLTLPGFGSSKISGDVNIYGNIMDLQYALNDSIIDRNINIKGNEIVAKYGSLNQLKVGGNFIMECNYVNLYSSVLNNLAINGNFVIDAALLEAQFYVLNYLNVLGDIKLPNNTNFGAGVLGGVISKGNNIISEGTTVSIGETVVDEALNNNIKIVVNEVETNEVETVNDKTTVQNTEIQATSGKVVEYQGGLEVYFQNSVGQSERIEGTARFSAPIAVKVPVADLNSEYVKVKVKHSGDEDFGYKGLTLNQENECENGEAKVDQYSGENILVEEKNGERYAVIYTCSASTFIAYTENEKKNNENNSTTVNTVTSSSSSGYGRRSNETNKNTNEQHNVADEQEKQDTSISEAISEIEEINIEEESKNNTLKNTVISNNPKYTQEQNDAYSFAKSNGITTTESIERAKMNTNLKRIEMAKILSNYAINVLGYDPDLSIGTIDFKDVPVELDNQYDNGVTLAYQLGIMGINMKNNKFRPFDEVTRVEFITSLSRLLYNTKDGTGKTKYYEPHITKLYNEGVITNTNPNPNLKEKRGNVFIMLMRATNK